MKTRITFLFLTLITFSLQVSAVELVDTSGPTTGSTVRIIAESGDDFGVTIGTVLFNGVSAPVSYWSADSIVISAPSGTGTNIQVQVIAATTYTCSNTFSYLAPNVQGISPINGPTSGGYFATISGENFGNQIANVSVKIGNNTATVNSVTHGSISCIVPAGAGVNQSVTVTVSGQLNTGNVVFNYDPPVILTFNPESSDTFGGGTLVISGTNFGNNASLIAVTIDGNAASSVTLKSSNDTLECIIPPGTGTNKALIVSVASQSSLSETFSYNPPTIGGLDYTNASTSGGDTLTINGTNFGNYPSRVLITVGGKMAPLVSGSLTYTSLKCIIPAGNGLNQLVSLTVDGQNISYGGVSYDDPVIASVDPVCIGTGDVVIISGENFGPPGSGAAVTISGIPATVSTATHTSLQVTVPEGQDGNASNLPIQVSLGTQSSNVFQAAHCINLPAVYPKMEADALFVKSPDYGVIMKSPDGKCWRLRVDNNGQLTTSRADCP